MRKVDKVRLPHAESLFPNGSNSHDFFHIRLFSYHKSTKKLRTHGKQNDADNKSIQQVTSKFTKQNRSAEYADWRYRDSNSGTYCKYR